MALVAECPRPKRLEKTQLYKGYWLAHLLHMDKHGAILSEWPVVKMTHGPGIERGADILAELVDAGVLRQASVNHGPFTATCYSIADRRAASRIRAELREEEVASIREACELVSNRTAKQLSEFSHEKSRAWKRADMGHELAIYADLVWDDEESEDLAERLKDAERHLRSVFG